MSLEVVQIVKFYEKRKVLDNLSFSVARGEVVGLLGPNGAGKTTAFWITLGLIRPYSGKVLFQGQDVTKLPVHKRAKRGMGFLAQEPSIFRGLSVENNILSILQLLKIPKLEQKHRLQQLLSDLHLTHLAKKKAVTLSGGERRRLEIARALVTNPSLLLLDEPFANIDPLSIKEVKNLIHQLKSQGISILITDHNAREIISIVDKSYLIRDGKVLCSGSTKALLLDKHARSAYFGEDFVL